MFSHVRLFATPWTVACQAPLPWDVPGRNTGAGCHFLLQGIFPTQGSLVGNPSIHNIYTYVYSLNLHNVIRLLHLKAGKNK